MKTTELSKEYWVENKFDEFKFFLESDLEITGPLQLTESVKLKKIEDDAFRYSGSDWGNSSRINFKDFIKLAIHNLERQGDIEITKELSLHAFYRKTYYTALLDHFYDKAGQYTPTINAVEPLKNYVLIIDEINRANLPSVLGELIYALEYRGEPVKSIYKIADDGSLVLPPNLLIIGTMNTADRSVGHIDYAIRRRFAFVEVLPSDEVIDQVVTDAALKQKSKTLYSSIASLFTKDKIASDFNAKDVQLGHSYFLAQTEPELRRKLEFEIKPILREYLKDGILLNETASEIEKLSV
ncbi:MAG: AAA family ATPase [Bacteroidia bacterium]|nr:AAA family ATPase [Bacteroidia bacterium]